MCAHTLVQLLTRVHKHTHIWTDMHCMQRNTHIKNIKRAIGSGAFGRGVCSSIGRSAAWSSMTRGPARSIAAWRTRFRGAGEVLQHVSGVTRRAGGVNFFEVAVRFLSTLSPATIRIFYKCVALVFTCPSRLASVSARLLVACLCAPPIGS